MQLGDIAAVYDPKSGRMVFAIVGDTGPAHGLGEGSVALLKNIKDTADIPTTYKQVKRFGQNGLVTVVFPGASLRKDIDQPAIDAVGQKKLKAFGGIERLKACSARF